MKISVRVKINAKTPRVEKKGEGLYVWLDVPPVEGRANRRLIELVSEYYGKPKSLITIKSGFKSRNKVLMIEEI